MRNSVYFIKKIERSVTIILGISSILDHFRHFMVKSNQHVRNMGRSKNKYSKVELEFMINSNTGPFGSISQVVQCGLPGQAGYPGGNAVEH